MLQAFQRFHCVELILFSKVGQTPIQIALQNTVHISAKTHPTQY